MFICNHCPFVKHLKKDIAKLTSFYVEVWYRLGIVGRASSLLFTFEMTSGDTICRKDLVLLPYRPTQLGRIPRLGVQPLIDLLLT